MSTSSLYPQRKTPPVECNEVGSLEITFHAWPLYGMVNLDIFSCEEFSVAQVVHFAKTRFQTEDVEVHAVERALRSPRISQRQSVLMQCVPSA